MEREQLLKLLASSAEAKRLAEAIKRRKSDVVVDGLNGSSAALYFAALVHQKLADTSSLLFVMDDEEEAGYFYHDLTQMLGNREVLFFPSSYRRAIKYNQKDDANELLRTNTLAMVMNSQSSTYESQRSKVKDQRSDFQLSTLNTQLLIVTYPDALAERVVSRQNIEERSITLKRGDTIDVTLLEDRLMDLGFVHIQV